MEFRRQDQLLSLLDLGTFVQRSWPSCCGALMERRLRSHLAPLQTVRHRPIICKRTGSPHLRAALHVQRLAARGEPSEDIRLIHVRKLALAGSTCTGSLFDAAVERLRRTSSSPYGSNELGAASFATGPAPRFRVAQFGPLVGGRRGGNPSMRRPAVGVGEVGRIRVRPWE